MNSFASSVGPAETAIPNNAVSPSMFQTSAYAFRDINDVDALLGGQRRGYSYTRGGNPNFDALARWTASLEVTEAAAVTNPVAGPVCGARTLPLRIERSSPNALLPAQALEDMPEVGRVYCPDLSSHPDHQVGQRLLTRGFGSIVSMSVGGGFSAVQRIIRRLKLVRFVRSLGDVSTKVSHPGVASHRELSAEEKATVGGDDSVVRVSVGILDAQDILADFRHALC